MKLNPSKYKINPVKIVKETEKILSEDYTQTLMISAVLGQMVESRGKDRFPPPAFFAFTEILSRIPDAPRDTKAETSLEIEERTTRIIELMTTLVSVLCEWSEQGVIGVADIRLAASSTCPAMNFSRARATAIATMYSGDCCLSTRRRPMAAMSRSAPVVLWATAVRNSGNVPTWVPVSPRSCRKKSLSSRRGSTGRSYT